MSKIGIQHPGEMGVSIGASALRGGHEVFWIPNDRSAKTRSRAQKHALIEVESLSALCRTCEIIISICPPHAAEAVSDRTIANGFRGIYLDANAISPERAIKMSEKMELNGIHFVDGGIIGGPAWETKATWLYLSGKDANKIADCFSNGPLETKIIGDKPGKASALKMCYAAHSKGTTALLCAVLGTAESLGVRAELYQHWDIDEKDYSDQANRRVMRATARAWRFEAEMREIESTFRAAGIPDGFHAASAEIYHRMADFKDASQQPELDDVLRALQGS